MQIRGIEIAQEGGVTTVSLHLPDGRWVEVGTFNRTMRTTGKYMSSEGLKNLSAKERAVDPVAALLVARIIDGPRCGLLKRGWDETPKPFGDDRGD